MDHDIIKELKANLQEGMEEYMNACLEEEEDPGYDSEDIQSCLNIVDNFLKETAPTSHPKPDAVMDCVKKTVLALNKLNSECEHSLIETDQREILAEIIIQAAHKAGVGDGDEDITGMWREW